MTVHKITTNVDELTICAKCRFYTGGSSWMSQQCKAPSVRREKIINVVTGEKEYGGINDLGGRYYTDNPFPYCRDTNIDGHCPHFKRSLLNDH